MNTNDDINTDGKHSFEQCEVPKGDNKLYRLMQTSEKIDVYKVYNMIAVWFSENRYSGLMEKSYLDELLVVFWRAEQCLILAAVPESI